MQRGIYPFAGATIRMPREAGWGNAMKHLLTGDPFDAAEAHRMGLVQEVVEPGTQLDRALELAERIATAAAPLGVAATLRSAYRAVYEDHDAAPSPSSRPTPSRCSPARTAPRACAPSSSAAPRDSAAAEPPARPQRSLI